MDRSFHPAGELQRVGQIEMRDKERTSGRERSRRLASDMVIGDTEEAERWLRWRRGRGGGQAVAGSGEMTGCELERSSLAEAINSFTHSRT